jgi:carbohydrate binding protein with CBM30 domain
MWARPRLAELSAHARSRLEPRPKISNLWKYSGMAFSFGLLLPHAAARSAEPPRILTIWNFDNGLTNSLGGGYNVYSRSPSSARTYLDPKVHHDSSGHSLRVTSHRAPEGFCGVWFEFFPKSLDPPQALDASYYNYLTFWLKGEKGGEDFDVSLSGGSAGEDTRPKVPLHNYLPNGATTEWQEVAIPLGAFAGIDRRQLTQLTLDISRPGHERFFLDSVALKVAALPAPASAPAPTPVVQHAARQAMWIWNAQELFDPSGGAPETDRLLKFSSLHGIRELYLSVDLHSVGTAAVPRYELKNVGSYQAFLERAHAGGLAVEALAGTPGWAAREYHAQSLAAVDAVLAFNHTGPAPERFDGVHFDVEPYSLIGFSDPYLRKGLLSEFLEMVSKIVEKTHAEPKFNFGCDVPAWFYPSSAGERRAMTVTFQGSDKTVGEHLTDLVDTVTIMDYRNEADGAGGIVTAGLPALSYAAARGKKIFVGLETSRESDSTVYFVAGLPLAEFGRRLAKSPLRNEAYFGGYHLATFSDGKNLHLGLGAPAGMAGGGPSADGFGKALVALAAQFGASSDPARFNVQSILDEARAALGQNAEWRGFETFKLTDPETHGAVAGFKCIHVMSANETFYGLGPFVFDEETRSAVEWLGRYPSFAGLGIHYYDTFRDLEEGK